MSLFLVPFYNIGIVRGIEALTATPVSYGEVLDTFETRCALDADRDNYTYLWTGSDQPVIWNYALGNLPTTDELDEWFGTDCYSAIYCSIEASAFNALSGDYNYAEFARSDNGTDWTTLELPNCDGDGELLGVDQWLIYTSIVGGLGRTGHFILGADGLSVKEYIRLLLGTTNSNAGANYKVYQLMHGVAVPCDFYSTVAREWTQEYYGGNITKTVVGKPDWHGHVGGSTRRSMTIMLPEIAQAEKNILIEVFKVGRGRLPVLWCHDEADVETWSLCRLISLKSTENQIGLYSVEIAAEEL